MQSGPDLFVPVALLPGRPILVAVALSTGSLFSKPSHRGADSVCRSRRATVSVGVAPDSLAHKKPPHREGNELNNHHEQQQGLQNGQAVYGLQHEDAADDHLENHAGADHQTKARYFHFKAFGYPQTTV